MLDVYAFRRAVAVTPSDIDDLESPSRALYIGTGGNLTVEMLNSSVPVLFLAVPSGTILPIRVTKVLSTGTGADDIISMY